MRCMNCCFNRFRCGGRRFGNRSAFQVLGHYRFAHGGLGRPLIQVLGNYWLAHRGTGNGPVLPGLLGPCIFMVLGLRRNYRSLDHDLRFLFVRAFFHLFRCHLNDFCFGCRPVS